MNVNQVIREMHNLTIRRQAFVFVTIDGKKPLRFFTNRAAIKASSQAFTLTYDRSFNAQSITAPLGAVSKLPEGRTGVCFDHLRGKVVVEVKTDLERFLETSDNVLGDLRVNGEPVRASGIHPKTHRTGYYNFDTNPHVLIGGDMYHADPFGECLVSFGDKDNPFEFHATPYPWVPKPFSTKRV